MQFAHERALHGRGPGYQETRLRTLELEDEGAKAGPENTRAVERQQNAEKEQIIRLQGGTNVSNLDGGATLFVAELVPVKSGRPM